MKRETFHSTFTATVYSLPFKDLKKFSIWNVSTWCFPMSVTENFSILPKVIALQGFLFFLIVIFYLFIYIFLYLFLAVLGLRFCARASSSCGKRGPLFIVVRGPLHYRGLSCCGAQAPDVQAQYLWLTDLVAPWHVGSSQTRAWTRVPCIGRQILNHCATREAQGFLSFNLIMVI